MSPWNRVAERNRVAVARNAERVLADTTYDRLRRPRPLLILALAYVVTTVAMPICWLAMGFTRRRRVDLPVHGRLPPPESRCAQPSRPS